MHKNPLLYPFSLIFGFIVHLRHLLFEMKILKTTSFDIPIISVGNITVGGTGKTPHTEFLINILKKDYKTAVLSRGYKRKTKGFVLGNLDSTSKQIGDEPKQMKQKFNEVTVAVCESRVKGVKRLLQENNDLDVILLDDAFQHRYIKPGLSILLIDYNRPVTDDHFIPYGNLRDNFNQTHRANIIIVTKTPENVKPIDMRVMETSLELMAFQSIYFTKIGYGDLTPVFKKEALMLDIEIIKNQKYSILLVSGIASPTPFIDFVKSFSTDIETLEFPDHHIFTEKDKNKISDVFNMLKKEKKL